MTTLSDIASQASATLDEFEATLRGIADSSLHQADPDGGWTVAQIVSHIHLSGMLAIAALVRLQHHDHLFMFREEVGHDALGAPPHSAAEAANRMASLRQAIAECLPALPTVVLERTVEVPPFGTLPMSQLAPGLIQHIAGHAEQARGILRKRGALA
jgi:hypothetical protein